MAWRTDYTQPGRRRNKVLFVFPFIVISIILLLLLFLYVKANFLLFLQTQNNLRYFRESMQIETKFPGEIFKIYLGCNLVFIFIIYFYYYYYNFFYYLYKEDTLKVVQYLCIEANKINQIK